MDLSRIPIQFHDGDKLVDGKIEAQITPRRLIVNGRKVILARTKKSVEEGCSEGEATIEVWPQWEWKGEDFDVENVFKFDDEHCWTVQGHKYHWSEVKLKDIVSEDDDEVE